jgi:predicted nuclease of predicted toxin-antitoxin system
LWALVRHGHDTNHTLDLPAKNATKDTILNQISIDEQRVVISKDADFFYSHLVLGRPWKLVLVKTGNMSKDELCSLFERHLSEIAATFGTTHSGRNRSGCNYAADMNRFRQS